MRMPLFSHRHSVYICRAKRHFDFRRKIVALCRGPRIKQILERADMKILEKGWNHGENLSPIEDITYPEYTSADSQRKIRKLESKLFSISKSSIYHRKYFSRMNTQSHRRIRLRTSAAILFGSARLWITCALRVFSSLPQAETSGIFLSRKHAPIWKSAIISNSISPPEAAHYQRGNATQRLGWDKDRRKSRARGSNKTSNAYFAGRVER